MTLGQEFRTYAVMVGEDALRLDEATALVSEINLGGTAIGTGLNAHPDYAAIAIGELCASTGLPLVAAIACGLFESLALLTAACTTLRVKCVDGIRADAARMRAYVENSIGLVTALNPYIGYAAATELAGRHSPPAERSPNSRSSKVYSPEPSSTAYFGPNRSPIPPPRPDNAIGGCVGPLVVVPSRRSPLAWPSRSPRRSGRGRLPENG
jgi:hypothetical protein